MYLALLAGQIMIAGIIIFLQKNEVLQFEWEINNVFQLVAFLLTTGAVSAATFLYSKRLGEGKSLRGYFEKFNHYRSTIILRSALIESANLICIIFFFLEKNYFFLLLFLFGLAAFMMVRPSVDIFKENYKLSEEERSQLKNNHR